MAIGLAMYLKETNELEVVRPGETMKRRIKCTNLSPTAHKVYGVQVNGNEIYVIVGEKNGQVPNRKIKYLFSSLSGGSSDAYKP